MDSLKKQSQPKGERARCPPDEEIRSFCFLTGGGAFRNSRSWDVTLAVSSGLVLILPCGQDL
eukprot:3570105-Rhodomonas_salina.4